MSFTGAEENVCGELSLWGEDVSFVTNYVTVEEIQKLANNGGTDVKR